MKQLFVLAFVVHISLVQSVAAPTPEEVAVGVIQKLKGTVTRDLTRPGQPVIGINL